MDMAIALVMPYFAPAATAFNRDIFHDRNQLLLYGVALGMTVLSTELGIFQRILGLTHLTRNQWLICIVFAVALLLVDEMIKFFLRRRRSQPQVVSPAAIQAAAVGAK